MGEIPLGVNIALSVRFELNDWICQESGESGEEKTTTHTRTKTDGVDTINGSLDWKEGGWGLGLGLGFLLFKASARA